MIWVMIYIIILTMSIGIVNIVNIIINMRTRECKEYCVKEITNEIKHNK